MLEVLAVYVGVAIAISIITIQEDRVAKGYKPDARDGDKDGIIQEGTKFERKAKK
jgi:hypothetical protein